MTKDVKRIHVGKDIYECHVDDTLMPALERVLGGTTEMDARIQALSVPDNPLWLGWCTRAIRWYRRRISPKLGNRCVFEPSCSHYAELAFREKGLVNGMVLTVKRLYRCRPGSGGIDLP